MTKSVSVKDRVQVLELLRHSIEGIEFAGRELERLGFHDLMVQVEVLRRALAQDILIEIEIQLRGEIDSNLE